jgi:hypothetical protein
MKNKNSDFFNERGWRLSTFFLFKRILLFDEKHYEI